MMNEKNRWITYSRDAVATWGVTLPKPCGDLEPLIRLGAAIADAGKRHDVFRLVRVPTFVPFLAGHESFETYLLRQLETLGCVPFFNGLSIPGDDVWTPARLAFYRGDVVVEEEVGNVGELLRELRPEAVKTCGMFMRSVSPLTVTGDPVTPDWPGVIEVQIRIDSDIWFPDVLGMIEKSPQAGPRPDWYDNRELAERHTPRLNAFLAELRILTLELGGQWEMLEAEGLGRNFNEMCDEFGIRL